MSGTTKMTVAWIELRSAALSATRRGWPVVPGTFLGTNRRWHGREKATRLCPIHDTWQQAPITDPDQAYETWSQHPYGVLLVCGRGVDALELPGRMLGLLPTLTPGGPPVPIVATTPPPRWLLLTATGSPTLTPELQAAGARLHTAGSWVALPPTTVEFLSLQQWWTGIPREHTPTTLRPAQHVQQVLVNALRRSALDPGPRDDNED